MSGKTYLRSDMFYITLDGDPTPWDRAEGGDVTYSRRKTVYEDLTISRPRQHDSPVVSLIERVGKRTEVKLIYLNADGTKSDYGVVYEGKLLQFRPATADANHCEIATDRVVLSPTAIRPLAA
jgi:hypothetical protein